MTDAAKAAEGTDESCPICLNDMSTSDVCHPIKCRGTCNFNFCINCLTSLLASSKDDYELASDGNLAVKIHLNCPNCRADISGTIEDTIRLRQKARADELQKVPDSELSAKELQLKYWNENDGPLIEEEKKKKKQNGVKPLEIDPSLFGGLDFAMTEQEQKYVTQLMISGYPDQLCQAAQILSGIAELLRKGKSPMQNAARKSLDSSPGNNNQSAANNAAASTARATAALQAANTNNTTTMRHGYSNAGVRTNRSSDGERETHVSNFQRQMEQKAREKLRRPLPSRMPLCVTLSTAEFERMAFKAREEAEGLVDPPANEQPKGWLRGWLGRGAGGRAATMTFVDDEWDGTVADAFARARIGTSKHNKNQHIVQTRVGTKNPVEIKAIEKILALGEQDSEEERQERMPLTRSQRVLVGSVRGQAGKSGIMKGDVVTHVNGEVFTGDAANLNASLVNAYEEQGQDGVVMIVVNAEACTAEALRLRARVR